MLYTRKGDNGTTKLYGCKSARITKSSSIFEVLGTVDELNSSIGYAKALSKKHKLFLPTESGRMMYTEILETFQQALFCIQAELGGAMVATKSSQVLYLEEIIYEVETSLPPIKSFIVPGGGEAGAYLDVIRTIARRAERGCVALCDTREKEVSSVSLEFLNRLSSALYALARFANYQEGFTERPPGYG